MSVHPPDLMLACTIGPIDAGIIGELEEAYTRKTGVVIAHVGAGTGDALEMARGGKFDVVIVCQPPVSGRHPI